MSRDGVVFLAMADRLMHNQKADFSCSLICISRWVNPAHQLYSTLQVFGTKETADTGAETMVIAFSLEEY